MAEKIVLNINGDAITFNVTNEDHEKLINELQPTNKVGPMHNFLMRSVEKESKEALTPLLKNPSHVLTIAEKVIEKFVPQLEITVGE